VGVYGHRHRDKKVVGVFILNFSCARFKYDTQNSRTLSAMGIVMKRRDNAPITKVVYGGPGRDSAERTSKPPSFVRSSLMKLVDGDVPIEQLIISKTLRGSYVNPNSIVHAALANACANGLAPLPRSTTASSTPSSSRTTPKLFE
jgi:hypothetical protein